MNKTLAVVIACMLALWGICACDDAISTGPQTNNDGGIQGGAQGEPNPLDLEQARELLAPLAEAQCAWLFGCCSTDELAADLGPSVADADECALRLVDRAGRGSGFYSSLSNDFPMALQRLARLAYASYAPRFEIDDKAIAKCAKATRDRSCNEGAGDACEPKTPLSPAADPCDLRKLFVGSQAMGDVCDVTEGDLECASNLHCVATDYPQGVCLSAVPDKGLCIEERDCERGLRCDPKKGICVQGIAEGKACSFADPLHPVPGTEKEPCAWGLICDAATLECADARCSTGSSCSRDATCPKGLQCVRGRCGLPAEGAEPCWDAADCASGVCAYDSVLGESFCKTLLTNGVPCMDAGDCASGYCDLATTKACQPKTQPGDPCTNAQQCARGTCDFAAPSPVCIALGGEGDACDSSDDCATIEGFECRGKSCHKQPFAVGVSCDYSGQCASESCIGGKCVVRGRPGDACGSAHALCGDDLFCDVLEPETAEGECTAKKGFGEQCNANRECYGNCAPRNGLLRCDGAGPDTGLCTGGK